VSAPVIAIHAGAGAVGGTATREEARSRAALLEALGAGRAALESGEDAVAAVAAAVEVMEDFELFNAGRGAVLCADGTVELSAAVMRSGDRAAGAVASVQRARHPVRAAEAVMHSPQVLMVGPAADRAADLAGLEVVTPEYFITDHQRRRLAAPVTGAEHATVGAVCRDAEGLLAAATSTGGIRAQPPGRVGDCPLIGAGTWADDRVAVSCTGDGEAFIRSGVARYIAALVEAGVGLGQACERALGLVEAAGGEGGLIAVGADGQRAMPFISEVMPRGVWRAGGEAEVWVR
jgi:beta-aspartyl-peptidase (threonine type)